MCKALVPSPTLGEFSDCFFFWGWGWQALGYPAHCGMLSSNYCSLAASSTPTHVGTTKNVFSIVRFLVQCVYLFKGLGQCHLTAPKGIISDFVLHF
jgi:hypothetical protein